MTSQELRVSHVFTGMFTHRIDQNLELRLPEETDADEYFTLINKNRAHLRQWMPWVDGSTGPDKVLDFIRRSRERFARGIGFDAPICLDGRIIGTIGTHDINPTSRSTSLGYWLSADQCGRGIMTRAVTAMLNHLFGRAKLNRVVIRAATDNARSRAIPERLGFKLEGIQREAEWLYDHFVDLAVYSMLAREWARREDQAARSPLTP